MSEIEKMYENAEVKKQIPKVCSSNELYCRECEAHIEDAMPYCKNAEYPPFTAEKQIELIKWLSQHTYRNYIKFRFDICGLWYCECDMSNSDMHHTFEDALIDVLMQIWQDLTEEEQKQIADILKG